MYKDAARRFLIPVTMPKGGIMAELSPQHKRFADEYLVDLNGTQAAIRAGYSEKSAAVTASRLLRNANIRAYIDAEIAKQSMTAGEVLRRLAEHARGDLAEFIGKSDTELKAHPRSWLLKKYKRTVTTGKDGDTREQIEIELHDPQAALVHLGRYHKLFVDRVQSDDWRTEAIDLIRRGELTFDALAEAFDDTLAAQLFREAGVTVQT